jgi:multiple sugar transport system permease protein
MATTSRTPNAAPVPRAASPMSDGSPTSPAVPAARPGRRRDRRPLLAYLVVGGFLLWVLVPIALVAQNSAKPTLAIFADPPALLFEPVTSHYDKVISRLRFGEYLRNSVIVAVGSAACALLLGAPAAYALARLPIRGREWWARLALFARMVPAVVLVVPLFTIFQALHLINTHWALVAAHTTFNLPLVIWMMRSFFEEVPVELEEAARVDGASRLRTLVRVALPLTAPGLTATAILCLLFSWNEFLFSMVLSGRGTRTMPIGVSSFIGTVSIDWGGSSAAAVLAMAPIFVLGLAAQKFLVRGLTMGAVKG